ncbi:MAG: winged helix-turn-helix transcriptional regulator [Planctomycetes bacterium]|nr:winged helix-turn-helix transcriptional regulator [Planctomycetota bacterium]
MPTLAQEIGKQRPFESPSQEAYLNILRTASVLSAPFAHLFDSAGLSEATYNALRILRAAGAQGRLCNEIGAQLVARVPDVTRLVDRLEKAGLARRRREGSDRRAVRVSITAAGLARLADLDQPITDLHNSQLAHMSESQLNTLSKLLVKARSAPAAH